MNKKKYRILRNLIEFFKNLNIYAQKRKGSLCHITYIITANEAAKNNSVLSNVSEHKSICGLRNSTFLTKEEYFLKKSKKLINHHKICGK